MNGKQQTTAGHLGNTADSYITRGFLALTAINFSFYACTYASLIVVQSYLLFENSTPLQLAWMASLFFMGSVAARPFASYLVDRLGGGVTLLAGLILSTAAYALWPVMITPIPIGFNRVLQGVAMALFSTAITYLVADRAPASCRGRALSVFGVSANAAAAVGPGLGLLMIHLLNHVSTFLIVALLSFLLLIVASRFMPATLGSAETAVTSNRIFQDRIERRLAIPTLIIMVYGLTYSVHLGFVVALASARGMAANATGFYYVWFAGGIVSARFLGGHLSDRCGRGWVIVPGSLAAGLAMLGMSVAGGPSGLIVSAVIYGLGAGLIHPGVLARMIDLTIGREREAAVATFYASFEIGIVVGGPLFAWIVGRTGYTTALMAWAIAPALGAALYFISRQFKANGLREVEV